MLVGEELVRKPAGVPWAAARDAQLRSAVNRTRYTESQLIRIERARCALELVVTAHEFFTNYRKTCAVVKVDQPAVVDQAAHDLLEDSWKQDPVFRRVRKIVTPQGVCYQFYF